LKKATIMSVLLLLVLISIPTVFSLEKCIKPYPEMKIFTNMRLCSGVFELNKGIKIANSNINLDCNGAVLKGNFENTGIQAEKVSNITIKNCHIMFFRTGIRLKEVSKATIKENALLRNWYGILLEKVTNSALINQDTSYKNPVLAFNSKNNAISSYNRFIEGDFCKENYCNRERSFVEFYEGYAKPEKKKHKKSLKDILLEEILKLI